MRTAFATQNSRKLCFICHFPDSFRRCRYEFPCSVLEHFKTIVFEDWKMITAERTENVMIPNRSLHGLVDLEKVHEMGPTPLFRDQNPGSQKVA